MQQAPFRFLVDAPGLTEADTTAPDAPVTSRIQVFKTGRFRHPRWGIAKISRDTYTSFIENLQVISGGEIPVDLDHAPQVTGNTRAVGWIRALDTNGPDGRTFTPDQLWATVQWNADGIRAIRGKFYKYVSPTFTLAFTSDDETKRGPAIVGAALTNYPFLEGMSIVSLSRTLTTDSLATFAVEEPGSLEETYAIVHTPWDGSASRFSDTQWKRSCVLDRGDQFTTAKTRYGLPVREPNGDLNSNGVHAAAGRVGSVNATREAVAAAKQRLRAAYGELGETPPSSLTAGRSDSRPGMTQTLADIAEFYGLPATADHDEVLAAATTAITAATEAIQADADRVAAETAAAEQAAAEQAARTAAAAAAAAKRKCASCGHMVTPTDGKCPDCAAPMPATADDQAAAAAEAARAAAAELAARASRFALEARQPNLTHLADQLLGAPDLHHARPPRTVG